MPHYANAEVTFWWVTILVGFVVVLVAAALLQLLLSLVKDIDRGVEDVKATLAPRPVTRPRARSSEPWPWVSTTS